MRNALYTAYWNNIEARKDWERIVSEYPLAKQFDPGPDASYRKIDNAISKVKDMLLHIPSCPQCSAQAYTVKASEIAGECENVSACDMCGFIQTPIEYEKVTP